MQRGVRLPRGRAQPRGAPPSGDGAREIGLSTSPRCTNCSGESTHCSSPSTIATHRNSPGFAGDGKVGSSQGRNQRKSRSPSATVGGFEASTTRQRCAGSVERTQPRGVGGRLRRVEIRASRGANRSYGALARSGALLGLCCHCSRGEGRTDGGGVQTSTGGEACPPRVRPSVRRARWRTNSRMTRLSACPLLVRRVARRVGRRACGSQPCWLVVRCPCPLHLYRGGGQADIRTSQCLRGIAPIRRSSLFVLACGQGLGAPLCDRTYEPRGLRKPCPSSRRSGRDPGGGFRGSSGEGNKPTATRNRRDPARELFREPTLRPGLSSGTRSSPGR